MGENRVKPWVLPLDADELDSIVGEIETAQAERDAARQALSLLRSRVEALADELDDEVQTITNRDAGALGRRGALRDVAQRLQRSLSDNKEQQ